MATSIGVDTVQVSLQDGADPVMIPAALVKRLPMLKRALETGVGRKDRSSACEDPNSPTSGPLPPSAKRARVENKCEISFAKLGVDWDSFRLALNKIARVPFLTGREEQLMAEAVGALTLDSKDLNFFYFTKQTTEDGEICVQRARTVYELCEYFGGSMQQVRRAHDAIFGTVEEREKARKWVELEERKKSSSAGAAPGGPGVLGHQSGEEYAARSAPAAAETISKTSAASSAGALENSETHVAHDFDTKQTSPINPDPDVDAPPGATFVRRPRPLVDLHDLVDGRGGRCTLEVEESPGFRTDGQGLFPEDVVISAPDNDFDYSRSTAERKKDAERQVADLDHSFGLGRGPPDQRYTVLADLDMAKKSQGVALALSLVSGLEFSNSIPAGVRLLLAGGSVTKAMTRKKLGGSDIDLYLLLPFLDNGESSPAGADYEYQPSSSPRRKNKKYQAAKRDPLLEGELIEEPTEIFREVVSSFYHHVNGTNREYYIDTIHRSAHAVTFHVVRRQDAAKLHTRAMGNELPQGVEGWIGNPQGNRAFAWQKHPEVETFQVQVMTTVFPGTFDVLRRFDLPACQLACEIMPLSGPVRFLATARGAHALQTRTNFLSQDCSTVCVFRARKYWMRGFGLAVPVHSPGASVNLLRTLEEYYQNYCADRCKSARISSSHREQEYEEKHAILEAVREGWVQRNRPAGERNRGRRPALYEMIRCPFRWEYLDFMNRRGPDNVDNVKEPNPGSGDFADAAEEVQWKAAWNTFKEIIKEQVAIANEVTKLNFRAFWDSLPLLERVLFFLRENDKAERQPMFKSVRERQLHWDLANYYHDLACSDRAMHSAGNSGSAGLSREDESIFSASYYVPGRTMNVAGPSGANDVSSWHLNGTKLIQSLSDDAKARVAAWLHQHNARLAKRARLGFPKNALEDHYSDEEADAPAPPTSALLPGSALDVSKKTSAPLGSASTSAPTCERNGSEAVPPLGMGLGLFSAPGAVADQECPRESGGAPSIRKIGGGIGFYHVYERLRESGTHPSAMWLYFSENIEHILRPERRSIPINKARYWFFMHFTEHEGRLVVPSHLRTFRVFLPEEADEAKMVPDENGGLSSLMKSKIWAGQRGAWHATRGISLDATARELLGMPALE